MDGKNRAVWCLSKWEDSPFCSDGPAQKKESPAFPAPFAQVTGGGNHWTSRAHAASSPVWRCTVWLVWSGQQLQEEEMETLRCHQASFSAKEQLIPETASRGKRLSKDSRRKRRVNSNYQPPLGQGVVWRQAVIGEWGGQRRLLGKQQNVLFQHFGVGTQERSGDLAEIPRHLAGYLL